jgi:hypothetical protein
MNSGSRHIRNLNKHSISALSEGVCGDDPSTEGEGGQDRLKKEECEEKDVKEDGSEGNLPMHPDEVSVTVTGDHLADKAITLSQGVGEDDPSIIK